MLQLNKEMDTGIELGIEFLMRERSLVTCGGS